MSSVRNTLTLFYVADIHGSDVCFRKWLNAGRSYQADILILGGDITGKLFVPLYRRGGATVATWEGRSVTLETEAEIAEFSKKVRARGAYTYRTTPEEMEQVKQSIELERSIFHHLKRQALSEWIRWADDRLRDGKVRAVLMPGNDDPLEIDPVLNSAKRLENVGDQVIELGKGVAMASMGESTPTPWHTPRELNEGTLGEKAAEIIAGLPSSGVRIWNFHMPPYNTGIDAAPMLDADFRIQYDSSGGPRMVPVGSTALRALIEEHQPTVALHGHIHEGRGRYRLGQTAGFNPGSHYTEGELLGVLLRISASKGLISYTFTAG